MGVTELWQILEPVKQHVPLRDLCGQTIAIDLSIWICDSQNLQDVQTKPYLRNIFYRLRKLVKLGVRPVLVVDGMPPGVKHETIRKRCSVSNSSYSPTKSCTERSNFNILIKECCRMLDILGVPYVQSVGEAEAMCALLNAEKVVDACVTNDGDAFLYGAKTVYKNFTLDNKDPHVESYSMADIESKLSLSREHLVALALLIGCDYAPGGVPGVGRVLAIKLLKILKCDHILDRFRSWKSDTDLDRDDVTKPSHCKTCTHPGSRREHLRTGCKICDMDKTCDKGSGVLCTCSWHLLQKSGRACEVEVWKKSKQVPGFPSQEVIDEYLVTRDTIPNIPLAWKRPKVLEFAVLFEELLHWPQSKTINSTIPWLTVMDLHSLRDGSAEENSLRLHSIVKSRVQGGIDCLQIQWHKLAEDKVTREDYYVTLEDRQLFSAGYPQLVQSFDHVQTSLKARSGDTGTSKSKGRSGRGGISPAKRMKIDIDSGQQKQITNFFAVKKLASRADNAISKMPS